MLDNEHQCVSSDLGRVLKKLLVWPFYLSSEHWKKPLFSCREGERQRDSEETVWLWKVLHQEMSVLRLRPTQRATAKTSLFRNQGKWPAAQSILLFLTIKFILFAHKVVTLVVISQSKKGLKEMERQTIYDHNNMPNLTSLCEACKNTKIDWSVIVQTL